VTLTEAGAELLPKARVLVRDFEQQVSLVCRRHRDMTEELSFACMPTIAVHILAPVFEEFKRRRPDARVRLFDKSATEIGETVSSGLAEFGIAILASNRWNLTSEPLFADDYVCHPANCPRAWRSSIFAVRASQDGSACCGGATSSHRGWHANSSKRCVTILIPSPRERLHIVISPGIGASLADGFRQ
jgi:DNA-binding transcriptional LysR family regulator